MHLKLSLLNAMKRKMWRIDNSLGKVFSPNNSSFRKRFVFYDFIVEQFETKPCKSICEIKIYCERNFRAIGRSFISFPHLEILKYPFSFQFPCESVPLSPLWKSTGNSRNILTMRGHTNFAEFSKMTILVPLNALIPLVAPSTFQAPIIIDMFKPQVFVLFQ